MVQKSLRLIQMVRPKAIGLGAQALHLSESGARTLHELQRLQAMRIGARVPASTAVDVDVTVTGNATQRSPVRRGPRAALPASTHEGFPGRTDRNGPLALTIGEGGRRQRVAERWRFARVDRLSLEPRGRALPRQFAL